jgi:hypothetical protein
MCYGTSSGTLTQLIHFGPLIAIFLISYITISGLYCLLLWWPPTTLYSIIHLIIYCTWPIIIFYNYFNAIFLGPGFVPKNWKPVSVFNQLILVFIKKDFNKNRKMKKTRSIYNIVRNVSHLKRLDHSNLDFFLF